VAYRPRLAASKRTSPSTSPRRRVASDELPRLARTTFTGKLGAFIGAQSRILLAARIQSLEEAFMSRRSAGRHFLQIPGPTNVPDRVLRAIDFPTMDHRGPDFADLGKGCLSGLKKVFKTEAHVVIYPASGTGAWEAALVNTLSPGDRVLMCETGQFAVLWQKLATRLGLVTEFLPGDWRHGADPAAIQKRLAEDPAHTIKAVCVVHNETSTGVTSRIPDARKAIDAARHPALFMVDTISSLASIDYRHDEWGVDVTVAGSQKGLMLPPGLS